MAMVLDRTPFYAESGGQVGDTGVIRCGGFVFQVEDSKKDNDFISPRRPGGRGEVSVNGQSSAQVDADAAAGDPARRTRQPICCTMPCTGTWASTPSRPAARSSPTACGSTSPIPRRSAGNGSARSKRPSTSWS